MAKKPKTSPDPEAIRAFAREIGFDVVRFTTPDVSDSARDQFADFLANGFEGDMSWLKANADRRGDPRILWPEARSVIMLGLNYGPAAPPNAGDPRNGAISVYAQGRDYHDVVKSRLKRLASWLADASGHEVKVFVDTAPVMEKPLAQNAGIGWQGKHTNLVSREFGSWLFLGEVFTTLALPPDAPQEDHCGSCQRCLDICPTSAFTGPYKLDARRCISYLTIEHKGPIPRDLRALMGNHIYGCDDCLAVCPWNSFAHASREVDFAPRGGLTAPELKDLVQLDDAAFRRRFSGSPIKRTGRARFVRNVLIAIGNSGDDDFVPDVEARLEDEKALVRGAAIWALKRLAPARFVEVRTVCSENESDDSVREEWAAED